MYVAWCTTRLSPIIKKVERCAVHAGLAAGDDSEDAKAHGYASRTGAIVGELADHIAILHFRNSATVCVNPCFRRVSRYSSAVFGGFCNERRCLAAASQIKDG